MHGGTAGPVMWRRPGRGPVMLQASAEPRRVRAQYKPATRDFFLFLTFFKKINFKSNTVVFYFQI
jgi:hypothetical protein